MLPDTRPFIIQVVISNYKSIARCKLKLAQTNLLVGPNGAGKSNFLDSLRLVSDGLQTTLEHAIRQRGGIKEVRRRSGGHPTHFAISLHVNLDGGSSGLFAFKVGALPNGDFKIQHEQAVLDFAGLNKSFYEVRDGELIKSSDDFTASAKIFPDRFFLTTVSATEQFRLLFEKLSKLSFFNINPEVVKEPQPHDSGEILLQDGRNLSSVIRRLEQDFPDTMRRVEEYLRRIVPGLEGVSFKSLGPKETLEFRQRVTGAHDPWRFYANNMSDGTLRSLGVLTAIFHAKCTFKTPIPLVGIEEPESTIHPGAVSVLMDALKEASIGEQILATTHSPDLLDHPGIEASSILSVANENGETVICPIDAASKKALQEHLMTPGELLRKNQLQPDKKMVTKEIRQSDLFEKIS